MDGFQNRSGPRDGPDDFPTPKWATRAFMAHCMPDDLSELTVWEPAANRGYMSSTLAEFCGNVIASDLHDYGVGFPVIDFLDGPTPMEYGAEVSAIITNPPFNKAVEFFNRWKSLESVDCLAMLLRLSWMEGVNRYNGVFNGHAPAYICPYAERVPIVKERVDQKAVTQMPYAWFVWDRDKDKYQRTRVKWIPPCRKDFEKEGDYPNE